MKLDHFTCSLDHNIVNILAMLPIEIKKDKV